METPVIRMCDGDMYPSYEEWHPMGSGGMYMRPEKQQSGEEEVMQEMCFFGNHSGRDRATWK